MTRRQLRDRLIELDVTNRFVEAENERQSDIIAKMSKEIVRLGGVVVSLRADKQRSLDGTSWRVRRIAELEARNAELEARLAKYKRPGMKRNAKGEFVGTKP